MLKVFVTPAGETFEANAEGVAAFVVREAFVAEDSVCGLRLGGAFVGKDHEAVDLSD
jgi:hypothetical protein